MNPTRVVVDTDTASDDALALALATRAESLSVEAVTTVAGNVGLDRATANAKLSLAAAGAPSGAPPVHEGARRPLLKTFDTAEDVHGPGGLGEVTRDREGLAGAVQPDGLTVACAAGLDHEAPARYVAVDEREGLTRGYSLVDEVGVLDAVADDEVVTGADGEGFVAMVLAACRGVPPETAL